MTCGQLVGIIGETPSAAQLPLPRTADNAPYVKLSHTHLNRTI